jgi:2-polyprenyl-3-methyl-5-hydroxy-6-metoxy-1,4-benzoquinol methylase
LANGWQAILQPQGDGFLFVRDKALKRLSRLAALMDRSIDAAGGHVRTRGIGLEIMDAVGWHDQIASDFDAGYSRSPAFRERFALWSDLIARHAKPDDAVLDAGCGSGVFSRVAARHAAKVVALDGSGAMITIARQRAATEGLVNIRHQIGMLDELAGWDAASFDLILSSSVLEYVDDFPGVLANLLRLLRPGGRLIISMPNADSIYRRLERLAFRLTGMPRYLAHVKTRSTPTELGELFLREGVAPVETHYFAEPPLPGPLSSALGSNRHRKSLFVQVGLKS